jgi:hypothetical protein
MVVRRNNRDADEAVFERMDALFHSIHAGTSQQRVPDPSVQRPVRKNNGAPSWEERFQAVSKEWPRLGSWNLDCVIRNPHSEPWLRKIRDVPDADAYASVVGGAEILTFEIKSPRAGKFDSAVISVMPDGSVKVRQPLPESAVLKRVLEHIAPALEHRPDGQRPVRDSNPYRR